MRPIEFRIFDHGNCKYRPLVDCLSFKAKTGEITSTRPHVTIEQYVGLKDKNNIKIFEGDIVKVIYDWDGEESIHSIEYCAYNDYPAFDLKPCIEVEANGISHLTSDIDSHIKIIGNIHENQKLLKKD